MAYDPSTGLYITNQADGNLYAEAMMELANYNNNWNAEQVQKQMDFQERMSNTAHQREMEDLKAAGLNPVLSAKNGATSPSGSAATADSSIISGLATLFTKCLDIASDNAKANLVSTSKSYGSNGYGNGYSSASQAFDTSSIIKKAANSDIFGDNTPRAELNLPGITGQEAQGLANAFGIPILSQAANVVSATWNALTGNPAGKYDNKAVYNTVSALKSDHQKDPNNDVKYKADKQSSALKPVANVVDKVISTVKDMGSYAKNAISSAIKAFKK